MGFCLCPTDLAISKLAAGREKAFAFVAALLKHRMIRAEDIESLTAKLSKKTAALVLTILRICGVSA